MSELLLVAEIGINHNGSLETAKELIDMAKVSGCDAVKFQKRDINTVYTQEFLDSPRESPWGTTQRDQKEGLEFGKKEYDEIQRYCAEKNILWFASAWDTKSQEFLRTYNLPFNKIASAMLTDMPFVRMVATEHRHTFISTGMSSLSEIDLVVDEFKQAHTPYTIMHAVSTYPCKDEHCNIRIVETLQRKYHGEIGYSNHSPGILSSVLAVAKGATAIEAHITLDRSSYGSDQSASIEKHGLELLVRDCRLVRTVMGDGQKRIIPEEQKIRNKLVKPVRLAV